MTASAVTPAPPVGRIDDVDVTTEMQGSFLEYAYSVIYSRALPDARDGLKPVQRRILYLMRELGLRPDRGHVKSARVVGEVMGKLHPHGDAAIYDALVRLAQHFTLRVPLVDGHGNFGSLDDGPAAARYTEVRLASPAMAMTEGLDEDVVDFVPNYDGSEEQPSVLPSAIPNLLVNGASGIAVGMATNMAPHNLVEVVGAACHLLEHPDADLAALMEFVPGPDLPSGGTIVGLDGIRDAYAAGRGVFRTRATVVVEQLSARKTGLVVTELPYLVGPEKVIEKIKDGVNAKKLVGIADVSDFTDRTRGLRLVIGVKTGFNPQAVLAELYRLTPLEESFAINNVALVEGQPHTLGLRELLRVFLGHRTAVVTRRSEYRLARRRERLHLVDGLLIAILDIDEVIQVIRTSDDVSEARRRLREVFDLSEVQTDYILDLPLRRLTKMSRIELETEQGRLHAEIAELEALLASPDRVRALLASELRAVADAFGTPRRTLLVEANGAGPGRNAVAGSSGAVGGAVTGQGAPVSGPRRAPVSLEHADVACRVLLSASGQLARVDLDAQRRIIPPAQRSAHDAVASVIDTTSRSEIGAITSRGRLIRFHPLDLPPLPANAVQLAAGVQAAEYLGLADPEEQVIALVSLQDDRPIALGTLSGVAKRVIPSQYPNRPDFDVIALKPGDAVIGAGHAADDAELVFVASDAQLLRFAATTVRPQGCPAGGMAGISLAAGAQARAFAIVPARESNNAVVVTLSSTAGALQGVDIGTGKVAPFSEFPAKGRATGGVRAQRFLKGEDGLAVAWVGTAPPRALGADGSPRALPTTLGKRDGSGTPLDAPIAFLGGTVGGESAGSEAGMRDSE